MNWSLIVTLVISALVVATIVSVIVVSVVGRQKSALGPSGPGSPTGPTENCPVLPFNDLVECDPTKKGACSDCIGATLGYQCYTVDASNPYKYQEGTTTYDIPDGNWCLPTKVATAQCNEWTGIPILTKLGEGKYEWMCDCSKYPDWFTSAPGGDCTFETVCGYNSDPTKSIGELVCPPGGISELCKEGDSWLENPVWDPASGVCKCRSGFNSINRQDTGTGKIIKACTQNTCYPKGIEQDPPKYGTGHPQSCVPGTITPSRSCVCAPKTGEIGKSNYVSWIRCPEDVKSSLQSDCYDNPKCYPDPCNPRGYWDPVHCTCVCDGIEGSIPTVANNDINQTCSLPCVGQENPCISIKDGKPIVRGTCYYNKKAKALVCKDCNCPFAQDPGGHCKTICDCKGYSCEPSGPGTGGTQGTCCDGLECHFGGLHWRCK